MFVLCTDLVRMLLGKPPHRHMLPDDPEKNLAIRELRRGTHVHDEPASSQLMSPFRRLFGLVVRDASASSNFIAPLTNDACATLPALQIMQISNRPMHQIGDSDMEMHQICSHPDHEIGESERQMQHRF